MIHFSENIEVSVVLHNSPDCSYQWLLLLLTHITIFTYCTGNCRFTTYDSNNVMLSIQEEVL